MDEHSFKNNVLFAAIGIVILVSVAGLLFTMLTSCNYLTPTEKKVCEEIVEEVIEDVIIEETHCNPDYNPLTPLRKNEQLG